LFAAMRRALVIAGVMPAVLLALVPALATAASPRSDKEVPLVELEEELIEEHEVTVFSLSVEGFAVDVSAEEEGDEQTVTLSIARDGLASTYVVPAKITDHSVAARFGALGELNFHFGPKKGARKCPGKLAFTGSFTFTGENGYIHVDADEAEGARVGEELESCSGEEEGGGIVAVDESVFLEAVAGPFKRGTGRRVAVEDWRGGGRRHVTVTASRVEEAEGMRITRGATLSVGPGAFHHNLKAGTATLKPPAPFTGWARMTPGRGGKGTWEGTLKIPTLGGSPIELTGPAFRARFVNERAFDE
jgi:hypothetical protein